MLVEILCGGYGCRTKTGIHTVMRGEQCEVSESEARRLIGLGVAKSPYITDRGTASTLAAAPATAEGNDTPTAETQQGGSGTAHLDPNQLQDMTVAELKKLAADMGISLSPVYHISGISDTAELQNVLNAQNDSLRELVLEIVKDAEDDDFRGRYA